MKHKLSNLKERTLDWARNNKKIVIPLSVLFAALFLFGIVTIITSDDSSQVNRSGAEESARADQEVKAQTKTSPLSGLEVSPEAAARPVTAFVIENSPDARPQSSLNQAGFIFEAIAEGGITRYVAVYQENAPDIIGPVRSLRPYFIDVVQTFDASIGHVGGSVDALEEARSLGLKDLDEFQFGNSFYRATDRFAPHNVYTDFERIDALNERLGYNSSDFTSFERKLPRPLEVPTASTITVPVSSFLYQSDYTYNAASNSYDRELAGQPDRDRESEKQLSPSVVVVIETPAQIAEDGRYSYQLTGSGKVSIFQDGDVSVGTWTKESRTDQFVFIDDTGDDIKLNPGQVWMSVLTPDQEVQYQP